MLDKPSIALCCMLLVLPVPALAHGGGTDLKGTLQSASAEEIVVQDESGAAHPIRVDSSTRYRTSRGAAARLSDLHPGDRVVVHLGVAAKRSTALEVRFGPAARPGASP